MEKIFNEAANKGGVYQIRNNANGKVYVGSTNRFKQRVMEHERSLRNNKHQNKHLQHAFNQYGENAFIFEVLEVVEGLDEIKWRSIEKKYIDENYGSLCYNIKKNPIQKQGPWSSTPEETREKLRQANLGKKHSEETRKKISEVQKGKKQSEEVISKRVEKLKGQKRTPEQKERIGTSTRGKKRSPLPKEQREKISLSNKGHKVSEETRKKISEAQKGEKHHGFGKHHSIEHKKKISRKGKAHNMYGKHHSKETRKRMSEARKKYLTKLREEKLIKQDFYKTSLTN